MGNWDFFFSVHALERFFVPILLLLAPAPLPIPPKTHFLFWMKTRNVVIPFRYEQVQDLTRKVSRAWERERKENKRQSNVKCCAAASAWRAFHTLVFVYLFETLSLGNSWWRRKRELEKREKRNERENNEETWRSIYIAYTVVVTSKCFFGGAVVCGSFINIFTFFDFFIWEMRCCCCFGSNLNAGGVVSLLFLWPESNGFQHKGEEKEREKFTTRKFLNSIVYTYLNAIHSGSDEFFFSFLFLFRTSIKVCC